MKDAICANSDKYNCKQNASYKTRIVPNITYDQRMLT